MSEQRTLRVFAESIYSAGSEDGSKLWSGRDGLPICHAGPDPAPANHSATPAGEAEKLTPAISGLSSTVSFRSAALQSSLESKLQAKLGCAGSTEYSLTWKMRVTPAGRRIFALRASRRRKSDNGFSGWGSPRASEIGRRRSPEAIAKARERGGSVSLEDQVHLLGADGPPWLARMVGDERSVLNPAMSRWLMGFPARWDTLSPGYAEWQRWQSETCSAGSGDTATQSYPT